MPRLLFALSLLFWPQFANAQGDLGGEGGAPWGPYECRDGTAMVGLIGRSGHFIDTMQIVCGRGQGDGDLNYNHHMRIGPSNGGSPVIAVCRDFDIVKGFRVKIRYWEDWPVVSQIVLTCVATLDNSRPYTLTFGGAGGEDVGATNCGPSRYPAGLRGHSGNFIDAVGISSCRHRRRLNWPN